MNLYRRKMWLYSHIDNIPIFGKLFFRYRQRVRFYWDKHQLRKKSIDKIFIDIFNQNRWGNADSYSGNGSSYTQTTVIRYEIPKILREYTISSILDIPCGDFNWMQHVDLSKVEYTGADIVSDLINQNKKFEKENIHFINMDLTKDSLPKVDLVLVRDCFVHLSFCDINKALSNIIESSSIYLLTTTFPNHTNNTDISTGQWRPINLQLPPFNFPVPDLIIHEGNPNPAYQDKSIALWGIDHLIQLSLEKYHEPSDSRFPNHRNNQDL